MKCPICDGEATIDSEYKGITIYICPQTHRWGFEENSNEPEKRA